MKPIVGLALAMLLSSLGTSSANVALPTLAQEFSASFQEVQWIVLAYLLAITTLIVSVGRLGDLIGRRRLLLFGIAVFTVASIACGVAPMLWLLIAARAAQGLGAAIMMALTLAFIGDTVPKVRIGSAMGLLGTMSAIGTALGPSLGGVLISALGWRAIFFVNVPLGIATFLLAYRGLPVDRTKPGSTGIGFDSLRELLLAVALAPFALAMRMFRDRVLSAGLVMSLLVSTVIMATLVVGPFYLSFSLGLDAVLVGIVMSVGPIVVALAGVPAGRLADRLGTQRMTSVGLIAMVLGCFLLSMLPPSLDVLGYLAPLVIVTAGYATFQTANNAAVMTNAQADQRGAVSGMLNLSRNLGLITGASLMGTVFAFAAGSINLSAAHPEAVAHGMRTTFVVAAALIIIAIGVGRRAPNQGAGYDVDEARSPVIRSTRS